VLKTKIIAKNLKDGQRVKTGITFKKQITKTPRPRSLTVATQQKPWETEDNGKVSVRYSKKKLLFVKS